MKCYIALIATLLVLTGKSANAQKKDKDCGTTCFQTEILKAEKKTSGCVEYELRVSVQGNCAYALSHYSVEIPCGQLLNLSNSQNWKQVIGTDPTTGIAGFKIDDIPGFGETSLMSFTVAFTLCTNESSCTELLSCWTPRVSYKAATCVNYETVSARCQALKASLLKQDVSCNGAADGSLAVRIEEGKEPFTYQWSNNLTTAQTSGLTAGTYTVVVRDASGAEIELKETIGEPELLQLSGVIQPATCKGVNDGGVEITITGGTQPYTYTWSNGATTKDLREAGSGTYLLTVKDANGCSTQKVFSITNTSQISVSFAPVLPACNQQNGALNLSVTGGAEPYSYLWSNGETTEDLENIGAAFYSVTVTDGKGCSAQAGYNLREHNTLSLNASVKQTSCTDDSSGAVNLSVTGGTAPYQFVWSNGETTEDITGLPAGLYTVTVTDANGCTATLRANISKSTFQVESEVKQPACADSNDGSITVTPVGGSEPYTYEWSNGQSGNTIAGLSQGVYSVTITDQTGCSRKMIYVITNPPAVSVSHTITNTLCNENGSYSIDLTVSGGKAPYTYEWSNGATTEDLQGIDTGGYSVIVTDANGCSVTHIVPVEEGQNTITCVIEELETSPICGSISNQLATAISGADVYTWSVTSDAGDWAITGGQGTAAITFTAGSAGSSAVFTLTITKNGCTQTCSYMVSACQVGNDTDPDDPGNGGGDGDDDDTGGGDPNDPGSGPGSEPCDECFSSAVVVVSTNGSCKTYEVTVTTNGNCRHDLSHWTIAVPCGSIKDSWNSEGWKMEIGKDPTTGLTGLKVDDIHGFGKAPASFKVRFTLCETTTCNLSGWQPQVAYKAAQCVGYDTIAVNHISALSTATLTAYPNPFSNTIHFEWTANVDDHVKLEILDQLGKPVAEVFSKKVLKGERQSADWSGPGLGERIYLYRFTTSQGTVYGKLFKVQ
jgi:hypothetical protein